jgi:hypothetical protein
MTAFVRRCFLLLLLVCDWAGDPHMGRSPLSQPLGSQIVVCRTIGLHPTSLGLPSLTAQPTARGHLPANVLLHGPCCQLVPSEGPSLPGAILVYIHMSIRC